jgi:hypothetical protein
MSLSQYAIKIANPSPYERSDYVEVDLESVGVKSGLDSRTLCLSRVWPTGPVEEAFQIDYPFGRGADYRILTLFSRNTPQGDAGYERHTAEFLLEERAPRDFADCVDPNLLKVGHYLTPGVEDGAWSPGKRYVGVKLYNGGAPKEQNHVSADGLQVYVSLVPRPEINAPINYSGAATSVLHHRVWRGGSAPEALVPVLFRPHPSEKRWGQLTHIDIAPLPWERKPYQLESMLGEPGKEPEYTLVWSNAGPLRATATLKSHPIHLRFDGNPFFQPGKRELTCHLYRIVSVYPGKEFYTEQLILRPDEGAGLGKNRISLPFRAYFCSYVDYPEQLWGARPHLARFEDIPDYFCLWSSYAEQHRGYAFASEAHVRALSVRGPHIRWRLDRGHEHRCLHLFPFHGYSEGGFDPYHEIGHMWYEWVYKPLLSLPLNRYVVF